MLVWCVHNHRSSTRGLDRRGFVVLLLLCLLCRGFVVLLLLYEGSSARRRQEVRRNMTVREMMERRPPLPPALSFTFIRPPPPSQPPPLPLRYTHAWLEPPSNVSSIPCTMKTIDASTIKSPRELAALLNAHLECSMQPRGPTESTCSIATVTSRSVSHSYGRWLPNGAKKLARMAYILGGQQDNVRELTLSVGEFAKAMRNGSATSESYLFRLSKAPM